MGEQRKSVSVRVLRAAPGSNPRAEILVSNDIGAAELAAAVHKVATNEFVLAAAGLRACAGCKSGLDFNIIAQFEDVIQVGV